MWVAIGALIGVGAGVGAIILYDLIRLFTYLFLTLITGFTPPLPVGEGGTLTYTIANYNMYLIPVSTTLGGFLSGYMVYKLAPGSDRLGINAAIHAFHNLTYRIRYRTPAVKLAASAVSIGSGGSAGRDGPVALITAVFGSLIADFFHLDDHDRRIVLASGIGAGIGSIFMAPIGGAIMSTEILYKRDFEVEALIPAMTASLVGYGIFGLQFHYNTLFETFSIQFVFINIASIIAFATIGLLAGLGSRFFIWVFDLTHILFLKMRRLPPYILPAIGGLLVGMIGMFFPEVLGLGYGWVQLILNSNGAPAFLSTLGLIPIYVLGILFFAKILATSFTINSGEPGGVFAPSLVTGAFMGTILAVMLHSVFPYVSVAEMVVVTMIALFASSAKTPVSMIIMGTEMAGGQHLFLPLIISVTIAYLVSGTKSTIYDAQVMNRFHSAAHLFEYDSALIDQMKVSDAMRTSYITADPGESIREVSTSMRRERQKGVVILSGSDISGYVTQASISTKLKSVKDPISSMIAGKVKTIRSDAPLQEAIDDLPEDPEENIIVEDPQTGDIVGTVGFQEIAQSYENAFRKEKLLSMQGIRKKTN